MRLNNEPARTGMESCPATKNIDNYNDFILLEGYKGNPLTF
jgi:hypothetical protein